MNEFGKGLSLKGEISGFGELTIEGHVEGSVWSEDGAVTVAASAEITGDVVARDITVFGKVSGQLVATEVVDLRAESTVEGRVIAARLILNEGAAFSGRAEPQHLEAALRVARYQRQQRHGGQPEAPPASAPPSPSRRPPIIRRGSTR